MSPLLVLLQLRKPLSWQSIGTTFCVDVSPLCEFFLVFVVCLDNFVSLLIDVIVPCLDFFTMVERCNLITFSSEKQ